jgi:hypothetical protein
VKLKLDENLGRAALAQCQASGHDTSSIHLQNMAGAADTTVNEVCRCASPETPGHQTYAMRSSRSSMVFSTMTSPANYGSFAPTEFGSGKRPTPLANESAPPSDSQRSAPTRDTSNSHFKTRGHRWRNQAAARLP